MSPFRLIDLIVARKRAPDGYLAIRPVVVHHLRHALDEALGPGGGKNLIETGCGQEYRCALPQGELAAHVQVTRGFVGMVERKIIPIQEANALLDALQCEWLRRETKNKSPTNRKHNENKLT
jgi:hypothetical protein